MIGSPPRERRAVRGRRIEGVAGGVLAILVVFGHAAAQDAAGSISGTVLHPAGRAIADAPLRLRDTRGVIDERIRSSVAGRYEFSGLPDGIYSLTVNMPCCEFFPYSSGELRLADGQSLALDIVLPSGDLHVEGDDPAQTNAQVLGRQQIAELPVPRTADGRPDLSGVWLTSGDPYPEPVATQAWAQDVTRERVANGFIDHPRAHCLPGSPPVPGTSSSITKFVQAPELFVMLFEEVPGFRQVFLDGRSHPARPNPSWMGHSIGWWENDTLVIETIGFNSRGWTEVYPRSEALRMRERYRRAEYAHLEVEVTFDDPKVFDEAWTRVMRWDLAPQEELIEYVCENNRYAPPRQ
jgi:hypothetical protein